MAEIERPPTAFLHIGTTRGDELEALFRATPYANPEVFEPVATITREGDSWENWGLTRPPWGDSEPEHIVISAPAYAAMALVGAFMGLADESLLTPSKRGTLALIRDENERTLFSIVEGMKW